MAEVLVLVDHLDGNVKKVTTELLTKARQLGEPSAVFVGSGFDNAKAKLAEFGAAKVYVAADDELDNYVVAPKVAVLAKLVQEKSPAAVLIASGPEGKEIAGRLAVRTTPVSSRTRSTSRTASSPSSRCSVARLSCSRRSRRARRSSRCGPTRPHRKRRRAMLLTSR